MDAQSGQVSSQRLKLKVDKTSGFNTESRMRRLMADEMRTILPEGQNDSAALQTVRSESELRRTGLERRATQRAGAAGVTGRAVGVGLFLVALVAALTPYNDYVVQNSPFIGNHFPIGIMTLMAVLVLVINPLLMTIALRFEKLGRHLRPFVTGELIVMLTMMLIGAAVPSSGLIRYLEPMVVSPYWLARDFSWWTRGTNGEAGVLSLLPHWLVPSTDASSSIVSSYFLGIDAAHGGRVPMLAFVVPTLLWGILAAAILGGAMFLAAIFRRQWVHHERLSYPLATIPLELLAAPEPGKKYNALWRNPLLWTGAAIPLLVYFLAGLHGQFPAVPSIELRYDVSEAFRDRPWDALPSYITHAQVYLSLVGICFFVPSEIAFSMWLFVLLNGLARVLFARTSFDPAQYDNPRAMGTYVAYFAGLLWLARGHLKYVLVAAWKKMPRGEDEPSSYRAMVLGWVICMAVAGGWLIAAGMTPVMAMLLLAVGTMAFTLMSRIVAETGLFFVGPTFWPRDFFSSLFGKAMGTRSYFWTEMMSGIFYGDLRENIMPYATNSLRMGQELKGDGGRELWAWWFAWLGGALLLSAVVAGLTSHYLSYTHGRTSMGDFHATNTVPREALQNVFTMETTTPGTPLSTAWGHAGAGAVMATVLMGGRMLWAGWPFHPIGLVLMSSGPMKVAWFSIFLGWGAKRLLLRYGGAGAFRRARPFFIGLIVGEILSAGVWMFIGLATHGVVRYTLLPG